MTARLALLVAALQLLVLAFMAGQREWIVRTGTRLTLRTAPVDPSDPMRGAYVRLNYEISRVPAALCRGETARWLKSRDYREQMRHRDDVVYAELAVNPHGIADLVALSDTPPPRGPYLRGRVQSIDANGLQVRYGIEAYFTSQAAARKTEEMAVQQRAGAPMDVHVMVGAGGIGVMRDFAWEPLGLTLAFDRPAQPAPRPTPGSPRPPRALGGVTITLHNYGDTPLAIVDLPEAGSFRLVPSSRFVPGNHYDWAGAAGRPETPAPRAEDIVVLKPGDTHVRHLDLTQPQWWIVDTNKPGSAPIPMGSVPDGWTAAFRIEYAPPAADAVRGLPQAELVRHAPLRSRVFNANQGMD